MDLAQVKWSFNEYTLQKYVSKFSNSFPSIIKITDGFLGKQEIDSISSGTVIRVHSLYHQFRVTAETKGGKLFSLPTKITSFTFLPVQDNGPTANSRTQAAMTLQDILATYNLPVTVQTSKALYFKEKGDSKSRDEKLCELTLQEIYEETFLLGHPIDKGTLFTSETIIVPMYMKELKLVVAAGLLNGDTDKWKMICDLLTKQVINQGRIAKATFEEVYILDKRDLRPQEHNYSTIEPIYIDINEVSSDKDKPLRNKGSVNVYQYQMISELKELQIQKKESTAKTDPPADESFKSLHDIPEDLHSLTVKQVCECLSLLNMGQYIKAFEAAQVDGQLVYDLDADMMKSCLGMNGLNSIKFLKFRDGWRPNVLG